MRVLTVVLACLACTGHGRRVRMTIQGPSGFQDFSDGPVSGYASRGDSEFDDVRDTYGRRGRSRFNDARRGYERRENEWSDDLRDEYGRRGNSWSDDTRGDYRRRGSSFSPDIRRSELDDDFEDEYVPGHARRGNSLYENARGGYGRRGRSEVEDEFRFGDGRHGRHMTTIGSSGYADFKDGDTSRRARRGNSFYDGRRSPYGRSGRSEVEEDFRYGDGRHQVHLPSGGSSGYPAYSGGDISEHGRAYGRRERLDMDDFDDVDDDDFDDVGYVHGRRLRSTHEGPQGYYGFRDGQGSGQSRRGSSWFSGMFGTFVGRGRSEFDDY